MAEMRYYGKVITTTNGGYALLWQRYDNKKEQQVQSTTVLLKMYDTSIKSSVYISNSKSRVML
jgi:hypothetical protein